MLCAPKPQRQLRLEMPADPSSQARPLERFKHFFRERLSGADALPQLSILGLLVGIITAGVVLLFRFAIEWPLSLWLPQHNPENFEGLSAYARVVLPLSGAIIIATVWYRLKMNQRRLGVAFVIERLHYHQGYISFKSLMTQFFAGVATVLSGQPSGREGPAVHLGAASASLLGQKFKLPNNSIRTLIACGTASAISASFNTPIAGVIFAMEVVMMEYTIAGFTPVILASVTAAVATQFFYGAEPAFVVPQLYMNSLLEIPYIIFCGVVIGLASVTFVRLLCHAMSYSRFSIFYRILVAGLLTACAAYFVPQVMGIGYDTVNTTLLGGFGFTMLCVIALSKLLLTSTTIGLGMPNGLIGPLLFIGATLGGALGVLAQIGAPEHASSPAFYAMLGMGAMMGSAIQAPLAALMALLELTQNPNIILPGMLIIVVSSMFASEVFKQKSIFLTILDQQGLGFQNNPMAQALRRVGVGAIMERRFVQSSQMIDLAQAKNILRQEPRWILIHKEDEPPCSLLPVVDLANFLAEREERFEGSDDNQVKLIDLLALPAQREDVACVPYQATLQQALDILNESKTNTLYVERSSAQLSRVLGVVTRADVENYYHYKSK